MINLSPNSRRMILERQNQRGLVRSLRLLRRREERRELRSRRGRAIGEPTAMTWPNWRGIRDIRSGERSGGKIGAPKKIRERWGMKRARKDEERRLQRWDRLKNANHDRRRPLFCPHHIISHAFRIFLFVFFVLFSVWANSFFYFHNTNLVLKTFSNDPL